MSKVVQEHFGEAIIEAVRNFALSDLDDVQRLEATTFSHVGDAQLRQVLAETLYGARWVYKLGLALLVHHGLLLARLDRGQRPAHGAVRLGQQRIDRRSLGRGLIEEVGTTRGRRRQHQGQQLFTQCCLDAGMFTALIGELSRRQGLTVLLELCLDGRH